MSKQWYAVMISDSRVIATGCDIACTSDAALKTGEWIDCATDSAAPYVIQDFEPGENPRFHMTVHEFSKGGRINTGQQIGRIQRAIFTA